jgi:hypothetical protein
MKLTKKNIKFFEAEQKRWGTEVALYNWVWLIACDLLHDVGVTDIKTKSGGKRQGKAVRVPQGLIQR